MKDIKPILALVLGIAAVWYIISILVVSESDAPLDQSSQQVQTVMQDYSTNDWRVGFKYPDTYTLTETDLSTPQRNRISLALIEKGYVPPEMGEGPTAITVDIFRNVQNERYTAEEWIKGNSASNYKLGPGELTARTVNNHQAYEYRWSGLYEGKSVVVATDDFVYMFSVTFNSPDDITMSDFESVLSTARFGTL
ncbi:MAG: hypothetical protein Q8L64_04180 [bacterium]|nr:hypothetical protein [bacterium]